MDQTVFEFLSELVERTWLNIGRWISDHGFEVGLIVFVAWLVHKHGAQFLSRIFHSTIRRDLYPTKADRVKRLETIDSLTSAILRVAVYVIAGIMVISELGVNTTPIIASAGILGIALGFGAQSLIKDFTSGLFIIIDNQYRVGDIVKLGEIGGKEIAGKVEAITIRTTVLRALDGTLYHIPNGSIDATANLTMNYGGIEENIVFDEDTDINKLSMVIDRVGNEMAEDPKWGKLIKEPPHFVRIVGFDANGIKVKILGRTTVNDSWDVRGEFYRRLIPALRSAKIVVPHQQITVRQLQETVKPKNKS